MSSCSNRPVANKVISYSKKEQYKSQSIMTVDNLTELFDKWESVWQEEKYELINSCVADHYIRRDQKGDRTVTRDEHAAEIKQVHKMRPGIRVVIYDHSFDGNRAWFRFAFKWVDVESGEPQVQAGFQSYRIDGDNKLAETWLVLQPLGTGWADRNEQEH